MKIFLDTSDVELIREHFASRLIDGVTTNPTLMKKYGHDPENTLISICEIFNDRSDASISAEVVEETAEAMVNAAHSYRSISPAITIKVPCTPEGLKACCLLSEQKIPVNVTLIFSVSQAILAAKAGATYVSPFLGRVDDQRFDGMTLLSNIIQTFKQHNVPTKVLAASVRTVLDVEQSFQLGADIVTMPPTIFAKMYAHILTDKGIELFNADWQALQ